MKDHHEWSMINAFRFPHGQNALKPIPFEYRVNEIFQFFFHLKQDKMEILKTMDWWLIVRYMRYNHLDSEFRAQN